jgi:hypothetical protein
MNVFINHHVVVNINNVNISLIIFLVFLTTRCQRNIPFYIVNYYIKGYISLARSSTTEKDNILVSCCCWGWLAVKSLYRKLISICFKPLPNDLSDLVGPEKVL